MCSSSGACKQGTGQCSRFAGYTGTACDECSGVYTQQTANNASRGPCVYLPGSTATCGNGIRDGNELGVDCGGPNCRLCDLRTVVVVSTALIAGVSLCAFLLCIAISFGTWKYCRRSASHKFSASVMPVTPGGRSARRSTKMIVVKAAAPPLDRTWLSKRKLGDAVVPLPHASVAVAAQEGSTASVMVRSQTKDWGSTRTVAMASKSSGRSVRPPEMRTGTSRFF